MTPEQLQNQVAIAMIASTIIERLKKSNRIKLFSGDSDLLNRIVSILIATATAIGFTFGYSGSLFDGGTMTVTHPPLAEAFTKFLSFAVTSYGAQEGWYRIALKK